MTHRERLMTVLRGGKADSIPLTIYEWLIPDVPGADGLRRRGLTPIGARSVFAVKHDLIERETHDRTESGTRKTMTRIKTPCGCLSETVTYDPTFGSPWIQEHLVKSAHDYDALRFVLEHTAFEPSYRSFTQADASMGDKGIVLGSIDPIPIVRLWVKYMGPEMWAEEMFLNTGCFDEIHGMLMKNYLGQIDLAAESPAEVIWFPDNVTATMISPAVFEKYCRPAYEYASKVLASRGKLMFAHYDGANLSLADNIGDTGIDIIEAFTPKPMGDMTVRQARDAWPAKVLSINVPGILFREEAATIRKTINQYIEDASGTLVIGCTEEYDFDLFEHAFSAIADSIEGVID